MKFLTSEIEKDIRAGLAQYGVRSFGLAGDITYFPLDGKAAVIVLGFVYRPFVWAGESNADGVAELRQYIDSPISKQTLTQSVTFYNRSQQFPHNIGVALDYLPSEWFLDPLLPDDTRVARGVVMGREIARPCYYIFKNSFVCQYFMGEESYVGESADIDFPPFLPPWTAFGGAYKNGFRSAPNLNTTVWENLGKLTNNIPGESFTPDGVNQVFLNPRYATPLVPVSPGENPMSSNQVPFLELHYAYYNENDIISRVSNV